MIRVDTVTGLIAIDTETRRLQERIVITREPAGVQIRYEQPAEIPSGSGAAQRTVAENGRTLLARMLQLASYWMA